MFLFGAFDSVRGAAAPLMQMNWHLGYLQLGTLFAGSSVGYLIGSSISGFLVERAGLKSVLLVGTGLMALGVFGVLLLPTFGGHLLGFGVMGLGNGWMEIGINGVIPAIASGGSAQARYFNWLHGVYGVGACALPVITVWVIRVTGGWRVLYFALVIVLLLLWMGMMVTRYPSLHRHAPEHRQRLSIGELARHPSLIALLIAITAYVMAEVGLAGWLTLYLVHARHFSVTAAPPILAGFYVMFTIGRLTAHNWVSRLGNLRAIALSATASVVLLVLTVAGTQEMVYLMVPAGLSFAVIFPTITAEASQTFPEHAGKVLGFLFTASGIGSLAVNWFIGTIAATVNLTLGFASVIVFMAIVVVSMLPLLRPTRLLSRD